VPVIKDGKFVGIITDRDLREHRGVARANQSKRSHDRKLDTVTPRATLEKAAQLMPSHKIRGLPVTDDGNLVGVITASEILQTFLGMTAASGEGSAHIDFLLQEGHDLSRAAKIITEEGADVLSVGTHSESWEESRVCYLHLRGKDPNHLAAMLKDKVIRH
jgi:signal-transduction protein with cAMP-binding, CBS, and nucleotidyltransferase domain